MIKAIKCKLFWVCLISFYCKTYCQIDTLYVCERGESIQLNAPPGFYAYRWMPDLGLDNPTIANPILTLFHSNTFITEIISAVNGENLITNPGFEEGNMGFSSEYIFVDNIFIQGVYGINESAANLNATYFSPCPDPGASMGQMMVIDGYPEPNIKV